MEGVVLAHSIFRSRTLSRTFAQALDLFTNLLAGAGGTHDIGLKVQRRTKSSLPTPQEKKPVGRGVAWGLNLTLTTLNLLKKGGLW